MNRNVKANRVSDDWTVTFLQSVLLTAITTKRPGGSWTKKNPEGFLRDSLYFIVEIKN
jgi:hypothetical protein